MTIDTTPLKARADLLSLVGADSRLRKVAGTNGGEYAGPCPFCGGSDRLRVQPQRGHWWCRQCSPDDRWQDAIAYLMQRDRLTFTDACAALDDGRLPQRIQPAAALAGQPRKEPPPESWRTAALTVVEECEAALWGMSAVHARTYLTERGLNADTAREWRLGFNGRDREIAGLWVRAGVVLPWFHFGELQAVQVRLRSPGPNEPRYKHLTGSRPAIYGAHTLLDADVAVLTEGVFDALLVWQEAGDLVGIGSLGSAAPRLNDDAVTALLPVSRILVAYDMDAAGETGASRLLELSQRMERIAVPAGKDITEAWQAGIRLRAWIESLLPALPFLLTFNPGASDACPRGHSPLSRGGLACERCEDSRCVGCGTWMAKPEGLFCVECKRSANG